MFIETQSNQDRRRRQKGRQQKIQKSIKDFLLSNSCLQTGKETNMWSEFIGYWIFLLLFFFLRIEKNENKFLSWENLTCGCGCLWGVTGLLKNKRRISIFLENPCKLTGLFCVEFEWNIKIFPECCKDFTLFALKFYVPQL